MFSAKKMMTGLSFLIVLTTFAAPPPELIRQMDWLEENFWKFCATGRKEDLKQKLFRLIIGCRTYRDKMRRKGYKGAVEKPASGINTEIFDDVNVRVARLIHAEVTPLALTKDADTSLDYFSYRLALAALHQQNLQILERQYKINFPLAKFSTKNLEKFYWIARNYLTLEHNHLNDFRIQCYLLQQSAVPGDWHVIPRYHEIKDRDFYEQLRFLLALVELQYEDAGRNQRSDDIQTQTFRRNLTILGYYCSEAKTVRRKKLHFSRDLMALQRTLVLKFPYFKKEHEHFGETLMQMKDVVAGAGDQFPDLPELVIPEVKVEEAKPPAAAAGGKKGKKKK